MQISQVLAVCRESGGKTVTAMDLAKVENPAGLRLRMDFPQLFEFGDLDAGLFFFFSEISSLLEWSFMTVVALGLRTFVELRAYGERGYYVYDGLF